MARIGSTTYVAMSAWARTMLCATLPARALSHGAPFAYMGVVQSITAVSDCFYGPRNACRSSASPLEDFVQFPVSAPLSVEFWACAGGPATTAAIRRVAHGSAVIDVKAQTKAAC